MADLVAQLDMLTPQLAALIQALPTQRSPDEVEAVEAMGACLRELQRMAPALAPLRRSFLAADTEREQRHLALRSLLHDIRSPTSVLYSYLQLIARSLLFPHASNAVRTHADTLVGALRFVRDEFLQAPPLHTASADKADRADGL